MNYEQLLSNRTQFLSLTSLEPTEFTHLLTIFTPLWEKYYRYHTTLGKKRKIVCYQEHKSALLQGTGQKLFFLLVYLKNNPLQTFHGVAFGVSQPKVSQIIPVLLTIFDQTLKQMGLSPCRDGEQGSREESVRAPWFDHRSVEVSSVPPKLPASTVRRCAVSLH